MAYHFDKNTGDLVVDGFEQGIASSPHKGIANMQNVNINTDSGEALVSYSRVQQSQAIRTGSTLSASGGLGSFYLSTNGALQVGAWITVSSSTITSIAAGTYYVVLVSSGNVQLASTYNGAPISHGTSGTATFSTLFDMAAPIAKATENYSDGTATPQFRYYVLDSTGRVWVYDTSVYASSLFIYGVGTAWVLPYTAITYFSGGVAPSGMEVLNGWLLLFAGNTVYCKKTVDLAAAPVALSGGAMCSLSTGVTPHFAYTGHQGACYYTDGVYLGSIFPDSSLIGTVTRPNIQSYAKYHATTTTGTFDVIISGSLPNNGLATGAGGARVPAFFFTDAQGVQPTNLVGGTVYWIENNNGAGTFQVFAGDSGGAALNIATGASGNQYYNTFLPTSAAGITTLVYTPQRLNLPNFETATCMTEIGNTIIVGTTGNTLYPWNQIDATPSGIISLPEQNTTSLLTVNQMAYVFAGNKANVYITDGTVASLVIKIPDYCAGVAGTTGSYFEPVFTWGGSMYLRGRVYMSVLDQTSAKAGGCGGVWSFIPTQNLYIGQDTGLALRLENQNSYATYSGVATLLIPSRTQASISPQYWSAWYSSVTSPLYGIDYTSTVASASAVIETDIIPTGTAIQKRTFSQLEYKLAAPLDSGESVALAYRLNLTDAFVSCGAVKADSSTALSGYFSVNFQKTQWLQLQVTLNPNNTATGSFVRLSQILIR